jgi:hypothetical protein
MDDSGASALESAVQLMLGGSEVEYRITRFASGAISIDLKAGAHRAVIDGLPAGTEWGVSIDAEIDEGFSGHGQTFDSPEDAILTAKRILLAEGG